MKQVNAHEVSQLLGSGTSLNIIDVREVDEVTAGKIPGAVNIPFSLLEYRMHELDKSKEYMVVCRSGGRSGRACQFLESYGYKVTNMTGGMLAWDGEVE